MGLTKTIVRVGIVTGVLAGGAVLIAGPHRTAALFASLRDSLNDRVDEAIDEPTALRGQLRELEEQYPERISELRGDLAELLEQQRQVERDRAVADRVVQLADADLASLKPLLAQAQAARAEAAPGTLVAVRFANDQLTVEEAFARAQRIGQTRAAYAGRAADAARDLGYLGQQRERLEDLLTQLESERAEFRSQIWQLDRQVDAIARNDRLIELMERRQKTIEECGRYEAGTLAQFQARMAEVRSKQESQLGLLASDQERLDYEDIARSLLDSAVPEETPPAQVVEIGEGSPEVPGLVLEPAGPRAR
jgi:predicted nuclease with TOPRIM domain